MTYSGRILLIGGETDGESQRNHATRYCREVWQFDKKYNMMRIAGLMKVGRAFHSVTMVVQDGEEHIYVLGGKNTERLCSF